MPSYAPHPIGIGLGAGKSPEELKEFLTKATYADARAGGWDPAARMQDNEIDGVEADVLYTTLGFRIFWLKDAGLQADSCDGPRRRALRNPRGARIRAPRHPSYIIGS